MMMALFPSAFLALLCLSLGIQRVVGGPYFVLTTKAPKCFKLDNVAPETIVRIGYHAPDLDMASMEQEAEKLQGGDEEKVEANYEQDGVDARYNAGHNGKRIAMDARMRSTMNIVVTQRHDLTKLEQQQQDAKDVYAASQNRPKVNRERFQLSQKEGEIHFRTDEHDGFVEICLQSYVATRQAPTRMAVKISSSEENYQIFQQVATAAAKKERHSQTGTTTNSSTTSNLVEGETHYIVSELSRLERMTMDVFRKIQASTKREVEFREQSVKLNRAVRRWPIFRIACLLVGGYFQVSSVLDYMKRKHIY